MTQGRQRWPSNDPIADDDIRTICAHGDGSLDQHDKRIKKDVAAQKAFMVILEESYIIDVLAAAVSDQHLGREAASTHAWCPMQSIDKAHGGQPSSTASCEELLRIACQNEFGDSECADAHMIPTAITQYFSYISTPTKTQRLDLGAVDYGDWLYALHAGTSAANHHSPLLGGVEFGIPWPLSRIGSELKPFQPVLFGGIDLRAPDPRSSHAITFRETQVIPTIDLAMGFYGNLVDLENGATDRHRWAYGFRLDWAFYYTHLIERSHHSAG